MDKGELVPDEIVINMVKARLQNFDCEKGFIFDGFPRTTAQAQALEGITQIDTVINLVIPDWVLIEKILARRTCEKCGDIYNIADIKFGPNNEYEMPPVAPKQDGICDKCGGNLVSRSDETEGVIKNRLEIYNQQTQPLIDYYREKGLLKDVEVTGSPEIMVPKILQVLESGQPSQQTQESQQPQEAQPNEQQPTQETQEQPQQDDNQGENLQQ